MVALLLIQTAPGNTLNDNNLNTKTYYHSIVNLWNHPNHNAYPQDTSEDIDLGEGTEENIDVNPLQPFPGDVIMEGRLGQSVRLSGNGSPKAEFLTPGKPITILSNGRPGKEQPFDLTIEDINEDRSSVWMTSDHIIPLTPANTKKDSFKEPPAKSDKYQGAGIYLNSDRITINAKTDSILTSAKDSIALAADRIHLDGTKQIVLDADKIFLGKDSFKATESTREPILKGNQVENYLEQLVSGLSDLATDLSTATTIDGKPIPILNARGPQLKAILTALNNLTNPGGTSKLKSNTSYTE